MNFYAGILIIGIVLILILTRKASALSSLIMVPIIGSLLAGYGMKTFDFAMSGMIAIAPIAIMFIFAILFFGVLTDAGMFDPMIRFIVKKAAHDPVRITMGAALLAMVVHLDGSGAVTFLIAIPAMLPLFERLEMDRRILACVVGLGAGTMNLVPWGGPAIRAASALQIPVTDLYRPLVIPQLAGLLFVMAIAFYLGKKEKTRLGSKDYSRDSFATFQQEGRSTARPGKFWWNIILTVSSVVLLIRGQVSPALVFMIALVIALFINYPGLREQKERLDQHAPPALMMASILFAAGVFIGILTDGGMIKAIAEKMVGLMPDALGQHIPVSVALISMPASLIFDPDSFYFGFLPILAQVANEMDIPVISIGQAALLGQMTTGFPLSPLTASTFLLIGLCRIDLGEHQRFSFVYAFLTTLVMTVVSVLTGLFPL